MSHCRQENVSPSLKSNRPAGYDLQSLHKASSYRAGNAEDGIKIYVTTESQ